MVVALAFFGEPIPPVAQAAAHELAESCDILLTIGASGEVLRPISSPMGPNAAGR